MTFDTVVMVDWSGGNDTGAAPTKDAIWAAVARDGQTAEPMYFRNRMVFEEWIDNLLKVEAQDSRRTLVGFDFAFAYPIGFAEHLTGSDDPLAVWDWFEERVKDTPDANNRCDIANDLNAQFGETGPFWGLPNDADYPHLTAKKSDRTQQPFPEFRRVEQQARGTFSAWQLFYNGAVGSQIIMGLPVLSRLRKSHAVSVWPFQKLDNPIVFAEIWPSLFADDIAATTPENGIKDAHQMSYLARKFSQMPAAELATLMDMPPDSEGWILGVPPVAKPLANDCFALPAGTHWTPVDETLDLLNSRLASVTEVETIPIADAVGRILTRDVTARRSNPPAANAAVDGYGFDRGALGPDTVTLALVDGRSAAGVPYDDAVPAGSAIRILTGAKLPDGVDTVVLQEDVTLTADSVSFSTGLKPGANARRAGEDVAEGDVILPKGRKLTAADIALLSITGVSEVQVHRRLRVAILSTGDELVEAGTTPKDGQINDANRPMLRAVLNAWGYDVVDLGRQPDDADALERAFDQGAEQADAILTSGGASAGDEDHVSALLTQKAAMTTWRIAVKPGRPLALAMWNETPVVGLPGNPVAALVCTLIFAKPSLAKLAGGAWAMPQGFDVPAAFSKSKKAGRREYLRARIRNGQVEVFGSEGSGRVFGLSWAEGLVELGDHAHSVAAGDLVRYIPYESFGL
ncbi:MAG: molybdopterin-binding protein [Paracoccaceae bacterium]|jgi:molybdopterin molybdotransferase|nr:molybdopterin-binding protein [Paracoccaceae bacterium]MDG2452145.1 molybdopterin-binding protein [Paracoccaceae bacterium]